MKCRHENANILLACVYKAGDEMILDRIVDGRRKCRDCNETLSLGPSNDSDARVAVEIRAAEIAARVNDEGFTPTLDWRIHGTNADEMHGWRDRVNDGSGDCRCSLPTTVHHVAHNWHAGSLARCIHETETQ